MNQPDDWEALKRAVHLAEGYTSTRQRPFLRRNLVRSIETLKRRAHLVEDSASSADSEYVEEDVVQEPSWQPPTALVLDALANSHSQKPLEVQLRALLPVATPQSPARLDPRRRTKPSRTRVNIELQLLEKVGHVQHVLYCKVERGIMWLNPFSDDDEPVSVEMEPMLVPKEAFDRPGRSKDLYERLLTLRLRIHTVYKAESIRLLSTVAPDIGARHQSGKVHVLWTKLPKCPRAKQFLPLQYYVHGATRRELPYLADLWMRWRDSDLSLLETYRKQRVLAGSLCERALPDPDYQVDVLVDYTFNNSRTVRALSDHCAICGYTTFTVCGPKTFQSFDQLVFHLKTYHNHMRFDVEEQEKKYMTTPLVSIKITLASEANEPLLGRVGDPETDTHWFAPAEPFRLKYYINGNNDWLEWGSLTRKRSSEGGVSGVLSDAGAMELDDSTHLEGISNYENVPDLTLPEQRKFQVPKAPSGRRFFRRDSKRPLEEGEWVDESDEEIDEQWLSVWREVTREPDVSEDMRAFRKLFDNYLGCEKLGSDIHLVDALFRFVRTHRSDLRNGLAREFELKMTELVEDRIVSHAVRNACVELVTKDSGEMKVDRLRETPPQQVEQPARDRCVCGQPATNMRTRIECSKAVRTQYIYEV